MTSIFYISIILLLSAALFLIIKHKIALRRAKITAQNGLEAKQGLVSRQSFDRQLGDRESAGRFTRRECTLLRLQFLREEVDTATTDMLVQHVERWCIDKPFCVCEFDEGGFAVLVEDVSLPDEAKHLKDSLWSLLAKSLEEKNGAEFILAYASYPHDSDNSTELWGVVAQRLSKYRATISNKAVRPQVTLREDGIVKVDYGSAEGVTYALMREAFQIYQDEISPLYPGIRFPRLIVGGRILSLDADAANFTRSSMMVNATSAIAVRPQGVVEKYLMRMFTYYSQPPYPFKICNSEEQAVAWLQLHVEPEFFELQNLQRQASLLPIDKAHGQVDRL